MMTNAAAEQVVTRVLDGDREAYREIVSAFYDELMMSACYRVPDRGLAEEIVQNTFVRAYTQLGRYQMGRDFGVWLKAIERFLILGELKKKSREEQKSGRYADQVRMCLMEEAGLTESEARENLFRALGDCIEGLPDHAKAMVMERYRNGKSVKDLAETFGRKVTWVTTSLYRTHRALRECIEGRVAAEGE